MSTAERQGLWESWNGKCFYCRSFLFPDDADLRLYGPHQQQMLMEPNFKTPLARGGAAGGGNCVPACRFCNTQKATRTADEYQAYLFEVGVPARFLDAVGPVRDWLLVATAPPLEFTGPLPLGFKHPHMPVMQ